MDFQSQGYQNDVKEYLGYLNRIEESLKPSNEKILEKISENISSMKMSVTEALKFETISLVNSLQVSTPIVQKVQLEISLVDSLRKEIENEV